jgi:hypothetical protein
VPHPFRFFLWKGWDTKISAKECFCAKGAAAACNAAKGAAAACNAAKGAAGRTAGAY